MSLIQIRFTYFVAAMVLQFSIFLGHHSYPTYLLVVLGFMVFNCLFNALVLPLGAIADPKSKTVQLGPVATPSALVMLVVAIFTALVKLVYI